MTQTVAQSESTHYTYRQSWSAEDDEFVATCVEFPSLSWLASDPIDALSGVRDLVAGVVADLQSRGEQVPVPLAERAFSGKLQLRLGPDLHRHVALAAAEADLTLNAYLVSKIRNS